MAMVVGHPTGGGPARQERVAVQQRTNAASVMQDGEVIETYAKRELPNYQVFDERRYFTPGQGTCVFQAGGVSVGLLICEDAWFDEPAELARESRRRAAGRHQRIALPCGQGLRARADDDRARARCGLPLVYAHLVGGQDEVVFEGQSFAVGADAQLVGRAPSFEEKLFFVQVERAPQALQLSADAGPRARQRGRFVGRAGAGPARLRAQERLSRVALGLSGGIDSALVLAVAVDALGAGRGARVMMPSPYTAGISLEDARDMARAPGRALRRDFHRARVRGLQGVAGPLFAGKPEDTTEENIQARIRGVMLMALSNKFGHMVLTTGNKSEMATGYCTLYGDMCGGFAVIKDV
jgi:NAD+ synthase (glutamine-hydrolysing)